MIRLKEFEKGMVCYDKAIDINPDEILAWTDKGISFILQKKYQDAIDCLKASIERSIPTILER